MLVSVKQLSCDTETFHRFIVHYITCKYEVRKFEREIQRFKVDITLLSAECCVFEHKINVQNNTKS